MMKIRVSSLTNDFESYELEQVVSIQYVRNIFVITMLSEDGTDVDVTKYSSGNVMVASIQ